MKKILLIIALVLSSVAQAQEPGFQNEADKTAYSTAGSAGKLAMDSKGKSLITYAAPGKMFQSCSGTNSGTSDVQIKAAVPSNRIYVTSVSCRNVATVASGFNFKDGSTEIWWAGISNTTLSGVGVYTQSFPIPLRLSVNTALNFDMETNSTSTICCAAGYISTT